MQPVEIYTSPFCGFCHAAKRLLTQKGVSFAEIDVARQPERRQEMLGRSGGCRNVPEIFGAGAQVGGCDAVYALDRAGNPDPLLAG